MLALVVFCVLELVESNRKLLLKNVISGLCYGMTSSQTRSVLASHGIMVQPLHGETEQANAFRDSGFSILDIFNSNKEITYFRFSSNSGLWLVQTKKYQFFVNDAFPAVEYSLPNCEK